MGKLENKITKVTEKRERGEREGGRRRETRRGKRRGGAGIYG